MGWGSLCFLPKSAGDNSSSCPGTIADAPQLERRLQRPPKGPSLGEAMAPLTRSRSRAASLKKLDVEEGGALAKLGRSISNRRKSKRVKKDDAELKSVTKENSSDIEGDKCGICNIAVTKENSFVTLCGHAFCWDCLKDHFDKVINSQMSKGQLTVEDVLQRLLCPNESCEEELKLIEIWNIVGLQSVQKYETWLNSVFDMFYGPSVKKSRLDCSTAQSTHEDQQTVISTNNLLALPTAQVRKALQVRGAGGKYLRKSCERELLNTVGMARLEERAAWVCTCCDLSWCAACGSNLSVIRSKRDRSKLHDVCLGEQRYDIYKSLVELGDAIEAFTQAKQNPAKTGLKPGGPAHTVWADGTGYGGEHVESKEVSDSMQAAAKRAELEFDKKVEKQLAFLTDVLSRNADDKPGKLTVASFALIRRENILSRLLQQLAQNDSMLDISERGGLYLKMVSLLSAMEMHTELRPLLTGHPPLDIATGKEAYVSQPGVGNDCVVDKDSTLLGKMGNIYRQAKVMLQNMPQPDRARRKRAEAERSLAGELCKCYESLERTVSMQSAPLLPDDGSSAAGSQRVVTETEKDPTESGSESPKLELSATNYKEALKKVQFRQLSMTNGKGEYVHTYKDHITGKVTSSAVIDKRGIHNHKRMIHLSKEVASLATTLPLEWESSIHLCVDECRLDVMRALIIGPQGTPYQNGLFLFDIFLPPDYPMAPPFVHFLTTGGGKVRFNPNLYDSGKICLSLLGTWSGPGWVGGKSTLLQVLVSIQSLIFVKDPYYNEPGFESRASPEAEKENTRHREHTLSLAVLAALRKPDPLFADIAREHFRFKRKEVENQCDEWVAATTDGYARQRIANIARDVKQELQSLCS